MEVAEEPRQHPVHDEPLSSVIPNMPKYELISSATDLHRSDSTVHKREAPRQFCMRRNFAMHFRDHLYVVDPHERCSNLDAKATTPRALEFHISVDRYPFEVQSDWLPSRSREV